jgi:predicted phosphohydrolase
MKLWHISDLHLSYSESGYIEKDMTKFGPQWKDWGRNIFKDWDERVSPEDIVLVGGDNAWPTKTYLPSMKRVAERPGRKLWIEGNHCKWVRQRTGGLGLEKFRKEYDKTLGMEYISGVFTRVGDTGILAQKLCDLPSNTFYSRFEQGQFDNELFHLENLVDEYEKEMLECKNRIFLSHYPFVDNKMELEEDYSESAWVKVIQRIKPTHCLYGHYHGDEVRNFLPNNDTEWNGIKFMNSSLDLMNFKMRQVLDNINQ